MARAATTADAFNAVAEPRRRQILDVLVAGERSVGDLVGALGLPQPQVSKHLKVLRRAGLVAQGRKAQWRPCRLEASRLKDVSDWVEHYRHLWEERFDRLDDYLRELQQKEKKHGRTKRKKRSSGPRRREKL